MATVIACPALAANINGVQPEIVTETVDIKYKLVYIIISTIIFTIFLRITRLIVCCNCTMCKYNINI